MIFRSYSKRQCKHKTRKIIVLFSIKIPFFCWFHSTNWRMRRSVAMGAAKMCIFCLVYLSCMKKRKWKKDRNNRKSSYSHCDLCSTRTSVSVFWLWVLWKMTLRHAINHFQFAWTFYAGIQFHRVTHSITGRCTFAPHTWHFIFFQLFKFNWQKKSWRWFGRIHKISIRFNHDIFVNYFLCVCGKNRGNKNKKMVMAR